MTITALPTPPSRANPTTFSALADALLNALPLFVTEANATAAAMNLNSTNSVSSTSLTIGTGSKTLTVETGKSYQIGMYVQIADAANGANYMHGIITAYTSGTGSMTVTVDIIGGSGTKTSWIISQSAPSDILTPGAAYQDLGTNSGATAREWYDGIRKVLDATGKIPYASAANVLAGLAIGTADKKLFVNAGGTLPEWAVGLKVLSFSRALDGNNGDVSYTGAGFKPSMIIVVGYVNSGGIIVSIGISDFTTSLAVKAMSGTHYGSTTQVLATLTNNESYGQTAVVKSADNDGCTLTYTKVSSASATISGVIVYFR